MGMFAANWRLVKDSITGFIEDNALSHGAAMAFYAATSLAPILLIVIVIAGLSFRAGSSPKRGRRTAGRFAWRDSAKMLQTAIISASEKNSGIWATLFGFAALLVTASGVFGEMQSALNLIWKVEPKGSAISRLLRARAASLGLVGALGFLMIVSLAMSAAITALSVRLNAFLPFGALILGVLNRVISFG